jgi:hypothetical protein
VKLSRGVPRTLLELTRAPCVGVDTGVAITLVYLLLVSR